MEGLKKTLERPHFILLLILPFVCSESRAHHKVHNLALYPERHSWCQAEAIRQEITAPPECSPTTIDNKVCLGACFSYTVPKTDGGDEEGIPPYCDACRPTNTSSIVVMLNCTREKTGELYQQAKRVEIILNCSCVNCYDNKLRHPPSDPEETNDDDGETIPLKYLGDSDEDGYADFDDVETDEPTLKKLRSDSTESKFLRNADEEAMIKENKIPSDDDEDVHQDSRKRHRLHASEH